MREKLSDEQVAAKLDGLSGWSLSSQGEIEKTFHFPAYKDGLAFAAAIGFFADAIDHHPDLLISYRKVRVSVSTHSAGGLTQLDFDLAGKIESLIA